MNGNQQELAYGRYQADGTQPKAMSNQQEEISKQGRKIGSKNDHLWPKMVKQSTRNRYPTRNNREQVKTAIKSEIIQEKHVWFGAGIRHIK